MWTLLQVWGYRSQQIRQKFHICANGLAFRPLPHEKLEFPRQGFPGWDVAPPASPRVAASYTQLGLLPGPLRISRLHHLTKITTQRPTSDGLGVFPFRAGEGVWSGGHPRGKGVVVQRPRCPAGTVLTVQALRGAVGEMAPKGRPGTSAGWRPCLPGSLVWPDGAAAGQGSAGSGLGLRRCAPTSCFSPRRHFHRLFKPARSPWICGRRCGRPASRSSWFSSSSSRAPWAPGSRPAGPPRAPRVPAASEARGATLVPQAQAMWRPQRRHRSALPAVPVGAFRKRKAHTAAAIVLQPQIRVLEAEIFGEAATAVGSRRASVSDRRAPSSTRPAFWAALHRCAGSSSVQEASN